MTTLMVVDGGRGETPSKATARRLRGELGERRISISEVARRIDMTQGALSRRMTGDVEFGLDLVGRICDATGVPFAYVTTGIREAPTGRGPDGGATTDAPNDGSTDYKSVGTSSNVRQLWMDLTTDFDSAAAA